MATVEEIVSERINHFDCILTRQLKKFCDAHNIGSKDRDEYYECSKKTEYDELKNNTCILLHHVFDGYQGGASTIRQILTKFVSALERQSLLIAFPTKISAAKKQLLNDCYDELVQYLIPPE